MLNGKSKSENGVFFYKEWKKLKREKNKNALQHPIIVIATNYLPTKALVDFLLKFKPYLIIIRLLQTQKASAFSL